MSPDSSFRRLAGALSGALFVLLAVLVATGFGGFANYSAKVRWVVAGLIVLYGVIRLRGALFGRRGQG